MKVVLHPMASMELEEAMAWYAERNPVIAEKLWLSVQLARKIAVAFPLSVAKATANTRRLILSDFPYDMIYRVQRDEIFVVAYAHHRRKPGYWKARK